MATTIKRAIRDELENLSKIDFDKFCEELLDRREEPRILRRSVEGKGPVDITQLLVSTFTEPKALQVALNTLRQINCNEAAQTLESRTRIKDSVDNGNPALPKTSSGELETEPLQEALKIAADQFPLKATGQGGPLKKPEEVKADAEARVRSEGGDPSNKRLVLSRFIIQFGKYKGQTFKWLLENDVGYAAYVVATHQDQRKWKKDRSPLMVHKVLQTNFTDRVPLLEIALTYMHF
uniref:Pyrin domain-containing protein n=1 Tax=Sparus aurata TaxID=8175 RepID=A0A671Y9X0_SPAAU